MQRKYCYLGEELQYDYETNQIKEYELKYWDTKAQLVDEVQNYINTVAPTSDLRACALIDACEKYNIEDIFKEIKNTYKG